MNIRSYQPGDLNALIELTIATFGPFYENHFRPLVGEVIFRHQHGRWADDYRAQVPALHDPAAYKYWPLPRLVQEQSLATWPGRSIRPGARRYRDPAVAETHRREHIGTALCDYAFSDMKEKDLEVVTIGTGGTDSFHGAARALYESLGCVPCPLPFTSGNCKLCALAITPIASHRDRRDPYPSADPRPLGA